MIIKLYKNTSENRQVDKVLVDEIELTGSIRDDNVDLLDPVITVKADEKYLLYNYAYIPDFERYYFFSAPPSLLRTGVYQIFLHVDVLMSFKGTAENDYSDGFLGNNGYVTTSMRYGNFYLYDSNLPIQQNTKLTNIQNFRTIFSNEDAYCFVLNCTNIGSTIIPGEEPAETS